MRKALNQGSFELYGRVYATLLLRQQSKQKRLATASSGQQRTDSAGVLPDASIPRFGVPHIKLDSFENVLDLTADACLESLQLTLSGILTHCFQTPRPTGNHIVSS